MSYSLRRVLTCGLVSLSALPCPSVSFAPSVCYRTPARAVCWQHGSNMYGESAFSLLVAKPPGPRKAHQFSLLQSSLPASFFPCVLMNSCLPVGMQELRLCGRPQYQKGVHCTLKLGGQRLSPVVSAWDLVLPLARLARHRGDIARLTHGSSQCCSARFAPGSGCSCCCTREGTAC